MSIILGTAGHIDHGKTSLVHALTGFNCDRLDEEKRRGITIELGFAHYELPSGDLLGIVDVPGHEKFIKNMVAGASGIDSIMLVVAADEGIMPQTKEHLEICTLLGIKHGFIVITKTDIVEPEWLEIIKDDITLFLKDTFLNKSPIFPVSIKTGEGLKQIQTYINTQLEKLTSQEKTDLFRMPIDRVFTMKGYGTIVTGTITSGSISIGAELELFPSKKTTKVRHLQNHGKPTQIVTAGQRSAINLHNLSLYDVKRGNVLALPGTLIPSKSWIISITTLKSSPKPIKHRSEIHFHHGTQEVSAQLYFFDRTMLKPGESSICEVRFKEAITGIFNDHCIIRSFSPLKTIAGGEILNPLGFQLTYKEAKANIEQLFALTKKQEADLVQAHIELAKKGLSKKYLLLLTNINDKKLTSILNELTKKNTIISFDKENQEYVSFNRFKQLCIGCIAAAKEFHTKEPLKQGMVQGVLSRTSQVWCKNIPQKLAHFIIEYLIKDNTFTSTGETIQLASHKILLDNEQQKLYDKILTIYTQALYTPPSLTELETSGIDLKQVKPVFNVLTDKKLLIRVKDNLYFSTQAITMLKERLISWFATHDELDLTAFKDLCGGTSRKYTIPLLEYFDKERITIRIGDKRHLRTNQNTI